MATSSTSDALAGATEATEFGAAIRDMRLALNSDLATVASTLRIRQVYLQAIEDGRFNELPGPTYAAGFVRAYAEYLGLDISEVMRRYREVALGSDRQAPLVAPSPVVEGTMPTGFILLVGAVLAAVAYGSWYYLTLNGRDTGSIVAQLPKQIAEIVGMETNAPEVNTPPSEPIFKPESVLEDRPSTADQLVPATVDEPETALEQTDPAETVADVEPASTPKQEKIAIEASEPETTNESAPQPVSAPTAEPAFTTPPEVETVETAPPPRPTPKPDRVAEEPAVAVEETPAPPVEPLTAGGGPLAPFETMPTSTMSEESASPIVVRRIPDASQAALPDAPGDATASQSISRVVLRATAISWVELRDADGKRVFSRLLKKGETYNVPGQSGITLATGNAGALDILVDGQTLGPLGPSGAVRRNVLLEPAALLKRGDNRQ